MISPITNNVNGGKNNTQTKTVKPKCSKDIPYKYIFKFYLVMALIFPYNYKMDKQIRRKVPKSSGGRAGQSNTLRVEKLYHVILVYNIGYIIN